MHRATVYCESNDRESYSGHGHVYWMFIEILREGDNIEAMGDHWLLQKTILAKHFS